MSSGEEKTEKPTAKKRKESRKEGQVPRTQELGAWAAMLLAGLAMPMMIGREVDAIQGLMIACLRTLEDPTTSDALQLLGQGAGHAFKALLLLGAAVMVVGVAAALAQGGFFLATKTVQPKLSKLDPIKGAKRIFGIQALWEGAKMLLKCALVAVLVKAAVTSMMPLLGGMVPVAFMLHQTGDEALALIRNVAIAGLVMAGADYAMNRRRIGKQTRMTKEEVKQEHKQQEGDPMLKGAIRSRQLAMARSRMMADVLSADVVLVNPTHVAVALRYDPDVGAPTVVARGAGAIAARIRDLAGENDVPLVQDVPLARALYSSTEVGQEIPAELFAAVAQVL
ncbi:MAG: EscU/YscU/HrcU family type III secretion system export apparatus switch protein, partial [Nocardioides sp.]|nr:EscU/YscU/HrcU family type III secretion system export apparatus switch protein [Nocardioides sp.]